MQKLFLKDFQIINTVCFIYGWGAINIKIKQQDLVFYHSKILSICIFPKTQKSSQHTVIFYTFFINTMDCRLCIFIQIYIIYSFIAFPLCDKILFLIIHVLHHHTYFFSTYISTYPISNTILTKKRLSVIPGKNICLIAVYMNRL